MLFHCCYLIVYFVAIAIVFVYCLLLLLQMLSLLLATFYDIIAIIFNLLLMLFFYCCCYCFTCICVCVCVCSCVIGIYCNLLEFLLNILFSGTELRPKSLDIFMRYKNNTKINKEDKTKSNNNKRNKNNNNSTIIWWFYYFVQSRVIECKALNRREEKSKGKKHKIFNNINKIHE